jgi:hypothetical protein
MIVSANGSECNMYFAMRRGLIHPRGACNPKNNVWCSDLKILTFKRSFSKASDKDGEQFRFYEGEISSDKKYYTHFLGPVVCHGGSCNGYTAV